MELKKGLLWAGIGALCVSALMAVVIFLLGTFGELETKLLMTTFTIGWYSLATSMAFGTYNRHLAIIAGTALLVSVTGVLVTLHIIWANGWDFSSETEVKVALILLILSFSLAHSSLLLKMLSANVWQNGIIFGTVGLIAVVGVMLINLIVSDFDAIPEFYYRFLAAAVVLDALGTILVPIVKKLVAAPATST